MQSFTKKGTNRRAITKGDLSVTTYCALTSSQNYDELYTVEWLELPLPVRKSLEKKTHIRNLANPGQCMRLVALENYCAAVKQIKPAQIGKGGKIGQIWPPMEDHAANYTTR